MDAVGYRTLNTPVSISATPDAAFRACMADRRNGVCLGKAFSQVRRYQKGIAYFPALSLSHGERCRLNFGGRPFQYPVAGFVPLQRPPPQADLRRASQAVLTPRSVWP